ncbi:hypothetical protein MXB_1039 [Myxobolus squamalis]|nr:hypothetical protein MXB_1039 [Myxobolus squamalis]
MISLMTPQEMFIIHENYRHRLKSTYNERFYYLCCASRSTSCLARINRILKDIWLIGKHTCRKPISGIDEFSSTKTYTVN